MTADYDALRMQQHGSTSRLTDSASASVLMEQNSRLQVSLLTLHYAESVRDWSCPAAVTLTLAETCTYLFNCSFDQVVSVK